MADYIITKTNGQDTNSIKIEYLADEEFKLIVVENMQLIDSLVLRGINNVVSKCMQYQQQLYGSALYTSDNVYNEVSSLKDSN